MDLLSMKCSSSCPSSSPTFSITLTMRSEPKSRIRSSSREMKKWDEPGSPWTAQLAVNAAGFVPLRADDVQPPQRGHALAQFDVRAAPGHVGGDGDRAALA